MFTKGEIIVVNRMPAWSPSGHLHEVSGPLVALSSLEDGLRSRTVEYTTRYLNHNKVEIEVIQMRWFFLSVELGILYVSHSPRSGREEQSVTAWFEKMITSRISTASSDD